MMITIVLGIIMFGVIIYIGENYGIKEGPSHHDSSIGSFYEISHRKDEV